VLPGAEGVDKFDIDHLGPLFSGHLNYAFCGAHDDLFLSLFNARARAWRGESGGRLEASPGGGLALLVPGPLLQTRDIWFYSVWL
jgi:hypothetical protein